MKNFTLLLLLCIQLLHLPAQLLPTIGLPSLPAVTDPVCNIPLYLGSFDQSGYQIGEQVPDFTLYDLNGQGTSLSGLLSDGKPVLLVAGSYTCPVFRNRLAELNQLVADYGQAVAIRIIYTVEAHPDIDISPYSGTVWTHSSNISAGILYRQPATYGDRKAVVTDMLNDLQIDADILIDGPCNEWWTHFGPAPNNAYLIDTTGRVYEKQGWFNRQPADMGAAIDSLLAGASSSGGTGGIGGGFDFQLIDDPVVTGTPGDILTIHAELSNYTAKGVNVQIRRLRNNLAPNWTTALCVDVCLAPFEDETFVYLPPNSNQPFTFYFYSSQLPDSTTAQLGFRNVDSTANRFVVNLKGVTKASTGVEEDFKHFQKLEIWPQPASDMFHLQLPPSAPHLSSVQLVTLHGTLITDVSINPLTPTHYEAKLPSVPAGIYALKMTSGKFFLIKKIVVE